MPWGRLRLTTSTSTHHFFRGSDLAASSPLRLLFVFHPCLPIFYFRGSTVSNLANPYSLAFRQISSETMVRDLIIQQLNSFTIIMSSSLSIRIHFIVVWHPRNQNECMRTILIKTISFHTLSRTPSVLDSPSPRLPNSPFLSILCANSYPLLTEYWPCLVKYHINLSRHP